MSFETPIMRDVFKLMGMLGFAIIIVFGLIATFFIVVPEIEFQMEAYAKGFTPCDRVGYNYYNDEIGLLGSTKGWNFGPFKLCNNVEELYISIPIFIISTIVIILNIILWRKKN